MSDAPAVQKPIPLPDDESLPFWEGAMAGKLMLMKCNNCGTTRMPSRQHCDRCLSTDYEWMESAGRGKVYTFSIMHQKFHPAFETPYNIVTVELDEGPRVTTNMVGIENVDIRIGLDVVVDWEKHEDVAIPKFRPA